MKCYWGSKWPGKHPFVSTGMDRTDMDLVCLLYRYILNALGSKSNRTNGDHFSWSGHSSLSVKKYAIPPGGR